MPQLFVLSGADVGRSFEIRNGSTLGRSPDCDVVLKDRSVSRRHAHVERAGPGWVLVDDGSRNGLKLGEAKVAKAELVDGQEVTVGELLMRFRVDSASAAASAGAPVAPVAPVATASEERASGSSESERRASASQPPAASGGDEEIVLEGFEDEPQPAASAPPAAMQATQIGSSRKELERTSVAPRVPPPALAPEAPVDTGFGRAGARAGDQLSRRAAGAGDRVLQYHKIADQRGVFASDMGQYPLWLRALLFVLVLAFAAGLFYAAFFGTSFLRSKVSSDEPAPESEQSGQ